jgi:hypothetical protein
MIRLSGKAREVIQEIRARREAPPGTGLKLIKGTRGELALALAAVRPGDIAVTDGENPLLVVDGQTASELRGCILDVRAEEEDRAVPTFRLLSPLVDL